MESHVGSKGPGAILKSIFASAKFLGSDGDLLIDAAGVGIVGAFVSDQPGEGPKVADAADSANPERQPTTSRR
jgi:hypothetical protein